MKKWNNLLLAGIALLSACTVIAPETAQVEGIPMTFTASFENNASTRTVLDGTNVLWQPGDAIAIGVLFVNYDDESLTCYIGDKTQIPSGYGIKLRKTVMMPVLIRSENMAPMIGTMMKGTVA